MKNILVCSFSVRCQYFISIHFSVSGQQNDSRMNLAIAQTAVRHGATCANHVEVTQLLSKESKAGICLFLQMLILFYMNLKASDN